MIVLGVLLLALVIAVARGGRIARLADVNLRFFPLLFVPFALQVLLFAPLPGAGAYSADALFAFAHVLTYGIAALVVAFNLRLGGFVMLWSGLMTNLAVIVANGGYMPVSDEARLVAGLPPLLGPRNNVLPMTSSTSFWFLGDILPIPAALPFAQVFSIGDVLIALGLFWFIQSVLVDAPHDVLPAETG